LFGLISDIVEDLRDLSCCSNLCVHVYIVELQSLSVVTSVVQGGPKNVYTGRKVSHIKAC